MKLRLYITNHYCELKKVPITFLFIFYSVAEISFHNEQITFKTFFFSRNIKNPDWNQRSEIISNLSQIHSIVIFLLKENIFIFKCQFSILSSRNIPAMLHIKLELPNIHARFWLQFYKTLSVNRKLKWYSFTNTHTVWKKSQLL